MARILDGSSLAKTIRDEITRKIQLETAEGRQPPGLTVVLVGNNPSSRIYVNMKKKACEPAGINSRELTLPATISQPELLSIVRELNRDNSVDGILVQMPLPDHIDALRVMEEISPEKDVDGFHSRNMGLLTLGRGIHIPCTPLGIIELLKWNGIPISGKKALIIGRSNIVGKPLAFLLLQENATVTIAHSKTVDLPEEASRADILIASVGKPGFVKGSWIKEGAVVVDVGVNSIPDASAPKGYRLVGDVQFAAAAAKATWITPVPGGVGPMTIAMLLSNTHKACIRQRAGSTKANSVKD